MASKDYQIQLLVKAINNATPIIKDVIRDIKKLEEIKKTQDKNTSKRNINRMAEAKIEELEIKNIRAKTNAKYAEIRAEETHATKVSAAKKKIEKITDIQIDQAKKIAEIRTKALKDSKSEDLDYKTRKNRAKQEISSKKDFIDLSIKELKLNDQKLKSEINLDRNRTYFSQKADREKLNDQRRLRRERLQKYTDYSHQQELFKTGTLAVSTPTAAVAALSLKNYMDREQQLIRARLFFGKDAGNQAYKSMVDYSKNTAFNFEDAMNLLIQLKTSQKSLGIKSDQKLIEFTKLIGNVLLLGSTNREDRAEIVRQFSQIAQRDTVNIKQDLAPIQARLPINKMIEDRFGMNIEQLKNKYSGQIPSSVIFESVIQFSKTKEFVDAIAEKSNSTAQSWDTTLETSKNLSVTFGDLLNKQLSIKEKLNQFSDIITDVDKKTGESKTNMIGFSTYSAISVVSLALALATVRKLALNFVSIDGTVKGTKGTLMMAAGLSSALYLSTKDLGKAWQEIKDDAIGGSLKNIDLLIASMGTLVFSAQVFAKYMKLGVIGKLLGALPVAAFAGYELGKYAENSGFLDKALDKYYTKYSQGLVNPWATESEKEQARLKVLQPEGFPKRTESKSEITPDMINVFMKNDFTIDDLNIKANTKVEKVSRTANPVSQLWSK